MAFSERTRATARSLTALLAWMLALTLLVYGTDAGARLNDACNRWVASTNAALLNAIGVDASVEGTYIHTATFSVFIVDPCNGLRAWVLLVPACMTLPFSLRKRLAGAVVGTLLICAFNQLRLVLEMLVGSVYPQHFDLLEKVVMRVVFASVFLLALWGWANLKPSSAPQS